eukprot:3016044-Amphidinium_carterae.1
MSWNSTLSVLQEPLMNDNPPSIFALVGNAVPPKTDVDGLQVDLTHRRSHHTSAILDDAARFQVACVYGLCLCDKPDDKGFCIRVSPAGPKFARDFILENAKTQSRLCSKLSPQLCPHLSPFAALREVWESWENSDLQAWLQ